MRRTTIAPAAALAALLAACGSGGGGDANGQASAADRTQPQQKQVAIRNRPHEQLLALPDHLRRVGLVRAIRDSGLRCPRHVEPNPVYQGDYRGMALWTARCDDNRQWAIFIAPNEDVQVRNCQDMGRLDLPACQELPPADPSPPRKAQPKAG